jgi:hypothetical protein
LISNKIMCSYFESISFVCTIHVLIEIGHVSGENRTKFENSRKRKKEKKRDYPHPQPALALASPAATTEKYGGGGEACHWSSPPSPLLAGRAPPTRTPGAIPDPSASLQPPPLAPRHASLDHPLYCLLFLHRFECRGCRDSP